MTSGGVKKNAIYYLLKNQLYMNLHKKQMYDFDTVGVHM